ncbi:uncharacterized protein LOC121411135 [Lytechinus variegatus]|uniref:uncharacterized protein LOC121411135 n=1 Tax=Lytechinus variegatus TaxID=7654 RepID=UPI001BB0DEE9|nr:uncharacterized protein LOC121411135 [Lytechinus variegatus]
MQWMLTPILDLGSRRAAQSVRIQLIVMPEAGTDYIHGSGLWRVGLFSSGQRDGRGVRHQYVRQILNEYETSRELTVSLPLRFDLNTDFNMEGIGCGDTRYICIEFTKGDRPRPNFNLPMTNNHFINCHLYRCKNSDPRPTRAPRPRPRPRPNPNPTPTSNQGPDRGPRPVSNQNSHLKTARLTNFRWNMQPVTYRDAMSSDINLRAWITPSPTTDFIHGVNLWRLGIFGNSLQTGKGPKVGYRRQVLPLRDANAPMHAAAPLEFEIPMQFELWRVGCNDIGFLCVEFAKGDSPDPNFNFPLPGGGAVVSCQRATCLQGRSSGWYTANYFF